MKRFDERIRRAIDLMESADRTHAARITLTALAGAVGMSASRFAHLYRQQTGVAPLQMLKSMKLKMAAESLVETQLSIKEAAFFAGFVASSSFCRAFKKMFAVTPTQYREDQRALRAATGNSARHAPAANVGLRTGSASAE